MSHVDRHYNSPDRRANDAAAVADVKDYLSDKQWQAVCAYVDEIRAGRAKFQGLAFSLEVMAGVSGYPIHALGRTFCLEQYREWMHSPDGGRAIQTDDDGFPLTDSE